MTFDELINKIESFEGFSSEKYIDSGGVPTIGYGFTKSVFPDGIVPDTISKAYASALLRTIIANLQCDVATYLVSTCGYPLDTSQLYALTDFTYNCGMANLKKLTNNGKRDITTVGNKILLYNKCNGKVLKGLTTRRQWEHDLFFGKLTEPVKPIQHTAIEIQREVNRINGNNNLSIDGKIGNKSINAIYDILHKL